VAIKPKTIKKTPSLFNTASSGPLYRFYVSLPCVWLTEAGIWKSRITVIVGNDTGIVKEACANCFPCGGTVQYFHPEVIPKTLPFQVYVDGTTATLQSQNPTTNETFDIVYNGKVIGQVSLLSVGPLTITVYPKGATIYVDPRVRPQPPLYVIETHSLSEWHPVIQWYPSNVIDVEALMPRITEEGIVVKARATATLKYAFAEDSTSIRFVKIAPTSLVVYSTGVYRKQPVYLYAEAYDQRGEYYELAMDEPMRITIDSAQYGNLYSISGQSGSSIVVPYQELYDFNVWFQVEGQPIVRPTPITATIQMANKPAVRGTTTFTYEPEIHHLVVRSVPNAIVHHGRSTLFVQAQDVDSNDVEFPWPETPVRLFYTDTTYGRLRLDEVVSATAVRSVPAPSEPNIQQKSVEAVLRDEVMKRLTQRHPELQKRMVSKSNKQGFSQKVSLMHTVGPLFLETTYADANVGKIIYEASGEAPTADQMIALTAIQYFTGFIGGVPQYFEGYSGTGNVVVKGEEQQLCPVVTITPSTIKAGETATITVKQKNADGKLIDYPAGTLFDIYMQDADAQFGDIKDNEGRMGSSLKNVTVPVTFIASGDIFNKVTISITGQPSEGVAGSCGIPSANLVIEDGCNSVSPSAPRCSGVANDPAITVAGQSNGFGGVTSDVCKDGYTKGFFVPMPATNTNAMNIPTIDVCYDESVRKWKVSVPSITINTILDLCDNNVTGFGKTLVWDLASLPKDEICDNAKLEKDLLGHYSYPIANDLRYYFGSVLMLHEDYHKQKYDIDLKMKFGSALNKKLNDIKISCRNAQSVEDARKAAAKLASGEVANILVEMTEYWNTLNGYSKDGKTLIDKTTNEAMEQANHQKTHFFIDYLKEQLKSLKAKYGCQ